MKRYAAYYFLWLGGVLSFAFVAYLYYQRIQALGADELERELAGRDGAVGASPSSHRQPPPAEVS